MTINDAWSDIAPIVSEELVATLWDDVVNLFGEVDLSNKGYSQRIKQVRSPKWGNSETIKPVRYTLFRDDNGYLICVHAGYVDESGVQHPWFIVTHPNYQRQGYATRLADFVISQREEEIKKDFPYQDAWVNIEMTPASAGFANKYAKSKLTSS
jgi:GNAT superfamily N-acetyltransferase